MKVATSDDIIIQVALGFLQVPTINKVVTIDVLCYYSPKFTSTLLSDNGVLLANKYPGEYIGQSMLKFFDAKEIDEMEQLPIPQL